MKLSDQSYKLIKDMLEPKLERALEAEDEEWYIEILKALDEIKALNK